MGRYLFLAAALFLAACGGTEDDGDGGDQTPPAPKAGDSCVSGNGTAVCSSSTEALECRNGTLRAASCRGPGGCVASDTNFSCDPTRAQAGDGCFLQHEGAGQCDASDANKGLVCTNGVWQSQACAGCTTVNGIPHCQ